MRKKAESEPKPIKRTYRPALTPEARESQMIALAIDRAEQQLRDGTASSQVITHFLKLASSKDRLEKEILEEQKALIRAKTSAIKSGEHADEMYIAAVEAMKRYSGNGGSDQDI